MAYILALDTTGEQGSLALVEDGRLIEEVTLSAPEGYAQMMFGEIDALVTRHGITLKDVDCFATAAGPGTFTGVRVGLTAVKGFADAADRPAVAVSNLQAVAWFGTGDLRAAYVDARRGQVYCAVYDAAGVLIEPEQVATYTEWAAGLPAGAVEVTQTQPLARAIADIGWHRFSEGAAKDPSEIDANYVRRSDAEMMWHDAG
ncbi:MAG: tRNA (adenosine(37)-N6)-threonylcarbamoyltransferase complex dimerization subunit type 1 TsaB [Acidobacteriota bacterium]